MANLSPLKQVYEFFQTGQTATTVVRRRYPPGGSVTGLSGLVSRGPYAESPVSVFEVPPSDTRTPTDVGARGGARRTLYSTHSFSSTDAAIDQPADVVFSLDGRAYLVTAVSDWNESYGYQVTLEYTGVRKGQTPFDV